MTVGSRARRVRALVAGAGVGVSSLGCAATIVPPPDPPDPRPVFLLDHGRHSSLVLPVAEGGAVRYSYGDWNYYARRRTGLLQALPALLWPTRAALGRRELAGPAEEDAIRRQVRVGIERLYRIVASGQAVDRLRARLDGIYESNRGTRLYNEAYDLEFVHHPRRYWGFHNSNQVVASWLEALGCDVRGLALFSRWKVVPPDRKRRRPRRGARRARRRGRGPSGRARRGEPNRPRAACWTASRSRRV